MIVWMKPGRALRKALRLTKTLPDAVLVPVKTDAVLKVNEQLTTLRVPVSGAERLGWTRVSVTSRGFHVIKD